MGMFGRTSDTVCTADEIPVRQSAAIQALRRELPVWRNFIFTSVSALLVWWLAVAVCLSAMPFPFGLSVTESIPVRLRADQEFPQIAPDLPLRLVNSQGTDAVRSLVTANSQSSGDFIMTENGLSISNGLLSEGSAIAPNAPYEEPLNYADQSSSQPLLTPCQVFDESAAPVHSCEGWQLLPDGLLYRPYLANPKEPRIQWVTLHDTISNTNIWEATLGGRAGLLRYGTFGSKNPQGFQLDLDGAVFARVLPDEPSSMLAGSDYRVGLFGTWRWNRVAYKAGYYHISSHLGDEFLLANPGFPRFNYVRDSLIIGTTYDLTPNAQIYGEIGNAIGHQGGAKPFELQFGAQYTPVAQSVVRGAPFAGVNHYTREDFNWITGVNVVAGWGWQGPQSSRRIRIGMQYYNGPSLQYSFRNRHENLVGGGVWFDF